VVRPPRQFVDGLLAVADHPGAAGQDRRHPPRVPLVLARAAIFGMGQRNEVVNEINCAQPVRPHPAPERGVVEAGMAQVEIERACPVFRLCQPPRKARRQPHDLAAEIARWNAKELEQGLRCTFIEDENPPAALDDGQRAVRELFQVGQADPVDAGRYPPRPTAPDQSADVEQDQQTKANLRCSAPKAPAIPNPQ